MVDRQNEFRRPILPVRLPVTIDMMLTLTSTVTVTGIESERVNRPLVYLRFRLLHKRHYVQLNVDLNANLTDHLSILDPSMISEYTTPHCGFVRLFVCLLLKMTQCAV